MSVDPVSAKTWDDTTSWTQQTTLEETWGAVEEHTYHFVGARTEADVQEAADQSIRRPSWIALRSFLREDL